MSLNNRNRCRLDLLRLDGCNSVTGVMMGKWLRSSMRSDVSGLIALFNNTAFRYYCIALREQVK